MEWYRAVHKLWEDNWIYKTYRMKAVTESARSFLHITFKDVQSHNVKHN